MKNNIVLCGFMGCGKSTVGKLLAESLDYAFTDSDSVIEATAEMPISKIFETKGEDYFRKLEAEVITGLSQESRLIIATGGGVILNPENVTALQKSGTVFFLDAAPETVLERLKNDTTRPLLKREDKAAAINELLSLRRPLYEKAAHYTVDANRSPKAVAQDIITMCKK